MDQCLLEQYYLYVDAVITCIRRANSFNLTIFNALTQYEKTLTYTQPNIAGKFIERSNVHEPFTDTSCIGRRYNRSLNSRYYTHNFDPTGTIHSFIDVVTTKGTADQIIAGADTLTSDTVLIPDNGNIAFIKVINYRKSGPDTPADTIIENVENN